MWHLQEHSELPCSTVVPLWGSLPTDLWLKAIGITFVHYKHEHTFFPSWRDKLWKTQFHLYQKKSVLLESPKAIWSTSWIHVNPGGNILTINQVIVFLSFFIIFKITLTVASLTTVLSCRMWEAMTHFAFSKRHRLQISFYFQVLKIWSSSQAEMVLWI